MLQWPASDEQEALDGRRDILDGKSYFLQLCMAIHRLWCQVFLHAEAIISQSSYLRIAQHYLGCVSFCFKAGMAGASPNTFQRRRISSQPRPIQDCHSSLSLRMIKRDGSLFQVYWRQALEPCPGD